MINSIRCAGLGVTLLVVAGAGPAGAADAFTFAWPENARAVVTVDVLKSERSMRYRYELSTEPAPDGNGIIIHSDNFEPLVFDGRDVDTPELRETVAPLTAAAAAVPSMRIGSDGSFQGFEGDLSAMFEALTPMVEDNPQAKAAIEAMRSSPQMQQAIAARVADLWAIWVGNWIGLDLDAGETREDKMAFSTFGEEMDQSVIVRNDGASDACAGCVRIQWDGILDDPAFRQGWEAAMRRMASQAGNTTGLDEFLNSVDSIERLAAIRVETDPATLQPYMVFRESTVIMRVGDDQPRRQVERATYRFDWSR